MIKQGHNYVDFEGMRIHFYVKGKGDPILFVHGWGSSWIPQDKTAIRYLKNNFTNIFLDLPGFGESTELKTRHTMENYSDFLYRFLKYLKLDKIYFVGHSMGTIIVTNFAIKYPKNVKKIILLGAPFKIKNENIIKLVKLIGTDKLFNSSLLSTQSGLFFIRTLMLFYGFTWTSSKSKINEILKTSSKTLKETSDEILNTNFSELYKKIKVPVLLIYGENDGLVNSPEDKLDNIVFLHKTGHLILSENPKEVSEKIINFFSQK